MKGSPEEAELRLKAILTDKVLWFNPYSVSDKELIACAERGYWRQFPALTQMVIFHFLDIREVRRHHKFDAIFYRVGASPEEHYFPLGELFNSIPHQTHKKPERTQMNGKYITGSNVDRLQHRSFFVSHAIMGWRPSGGIKVAYKMHRLKGNMAAQAEVIRQEIVRSKIIMLEEVLAYPESCIYLGYNGNEFDYATPLRNAIAAVSQFPNVKL